MARTMRYKTIARWVLLLPSILILVASGCTRSFEDINTPSGKLAREDLLKDNFLGEAYIKNLLDRAYPQQENWYQHTADLAGNQFARYTANNNHGFIDKQMTTFKENDGWSGWSYQEVWPQIVSNYNNLVKEAGEESALTMWGKIMRVQALLHLTDSYGPFPIGTEEDPTAYVSQEGVYKHLIDELNTATEVLGGFLVANPDLKLLPNTDIAYGGDISKWVKYAHSLKLRIALRISKVAPTEAQAIAEKAIKDGVIETNSDNMKVKYDPAGLYKVGPEWGDVSLSADMRSYLMGYNDPRLEKMFRPTESGTYYGALAGANIGSKEVANKLYSRLIYPRNSEHVYFNAAEVAFLKAEGALLGWNMGGTPESFYRRGVELSFEQWGAESADNYLADNNSKPASHVEPNGGYGRNMMPPSQITIAWEENASQEKKLERIITQKWLALYPNGQEGWTDIRRTGYPKLFDLPVPTPGYTIHIPNRIPYPTSEQLNNPQGYNQMISLLGGENNYATKMWWQGK